MEPKKPSLSQCCVLRRSVMAAAVVLPFMANAQRFDLGVKGGVNQDDLSTSFEHSSVIGGHAGLFARVKPTIPPGAQGELLLNTSVPPSPWKA